MVRRLVAAGVGILVVIVAVLLISGCLKSQKQQSLKNYNRDVSELAQESEKVSQPLFVALTGASAKQALDVEQQIDELLKQAQAIAARARGLSVPGEMVSAQRDLLLALDLRVEGMTKVAALVSTALGGQAKQASTKIAGDMELFLASDVVYSQRVAPLIQQTLSANGVSGLSTAANRFLPNLGWLDASMTLARITGQSTGTSETGVAPGHHGSVLKGVSVGTQTLEVEPALNHISGGGNPTFTAMVEDDGEFAETDVAVDVTVTVAGKAIKASHVIDRTEPGKTVNAEVPVPGIPTGLPAKVEVAVQPVPGETNHEGTKNAYLVIVG